MTESLGMPEKAMNAIPTIAQELAKIPTDKLDNYIDSSAKLLLLGVASEKAVKQTRPFSIGATFKSFFKSQSSNSDKQMEFIKASIRLAVNQVKVDVLKNEKAKLSDEIKILTKEVVIPLEEAEVSNYFEELRAKRKERAGYESIISETFVPDKNREPALAIIDEAQAKFDKIDKEIYDYQRPEKEYKKHKELIDKQKALIDVEKNLELSRSQTKALINTVRSFLPKLPESA